MTEQPATDKNSSKQGGKRRSERVVLSLPIEVGWTTKDGKKVKEAAESEVVNAHGAMIRIKKPPSASQVDLSQPKSSGAVRARVVRVKDPEGGEYTRLAVEFTSPNEEFWGIGYLLQRSTADLKQLVQTLEADPGEIDSRILTDFRDTVNQVRRISWSIRLRNRETGEGVTVSSSLYPSKSDGPRKTARRLKRLRKVRSSMRMGP